MVFHDCWFIIKILIKNEIAIKIKYLLFLQLLKISKHKDVKKITNKGIMPPDRKAILDPKPSTILALKGLLKYSENP